MPVASVGDSTESALEATQERIDRFAALIGDDNPLHVDADYADDGLFGERVAHGVLTENVVSAALVRLDGDIVYFSQNLVQEPGSTRRDGHSDCHRGRKPRRRVTRNRGRCGDGSVGVLRGGGCSRTSTRVAFQWEVRQSGKNR